MVDGPNHTIPIPNAMMIAAIVNDTQFLNIGWFLSVKMIMAPTIHREGRRIARVRLAPCMGARALGSSPIHTRRL